MSDFYAVLKVVFTRPLSCSGEETWQHGNSLVNYMKLVEMDGLTGKVKFDQRGLRTDFTLEIVELKRQGLTKVGSWHDQHGFKFLNHLAESRQEVVESLENKTLVVTTIKVSFFFFFCTFSYVLSFAVAPLCSAC